MVLDALGGMGMKVLNTYSHWWKTRSKQGKEHNI